MTTYPAMCPLCSCPLQLLSDGPDGRTKGTIEDALAKHKEVVHPEEAQ